MNSKLVNPYTMGDKTLLFTSQDARSLEIIEKEGRFINKREYIESHMEDISPLILSCYDWFVKEAQKRVNKPDDVNYQIWCSVSARNCMRPYEGEVAYVLEVPNDKIMYFEGSKWDYVLNLHYVPNDDEDLKRYQTDIRSKGFNNSFEFLQGRYARMYPMEEKKIRDSWIRVFDVKEWNIFSVQANIWEIRKEWIKCIIRPGESIPKEYRMD